MGWRDSGRATGTMFGAVYVAPSLGVPRHFVACVKTRDSSTWLVSVGFLQSQKGWGGGGQVALGPDLSAMAMITELLFCVFSQRGNPQEETNIC